MFNVCMKVKGGRVEVIKIDQVEDMKKYQEDWVEVERHDDQATFYQSYDYSYLWAKHNLDSEDELSIYLIYNNNKVVGIAPFYIQKREKAFISWTELKFIGMGDYRSILCDDRNVNRSTIYNLVLSTITELESVDRILLSYIPENNDLLHFLFSSEKYNAFLEPLIENPIVYIHRDEKVRPSKASKKRNRLRRDLDYRFEVAYEVTDELFKEFTELHKTQQDFMREQMGRKERRSHFDEDKRNRFVKDVSKLADRSVLFQLRSSEGELLFYRYCYAYGDTLYSWNSSYNHEYHNYNLSDAAILDILEYLEEQDTFKVFDLGSGGYAWKFRWTKDFHSVYTFDHWNNKGSLARKLMKIRG